MQTVLAMAPHRPTRPSYSAAAFDAARREITLDAGAVLYPEASPITAVYRVQSGVVRSCRSLADGRRHVAGFAFPGDVVGLDGTTVHLFAAEAVTAVRLLRTPYRGLAQFDDATDGPAHAEPLASLLLRALLAAQEGQVALGRMSAVERVARFLLAIDERLGPDDRGGFTLPMSRYDIADHLGLTFETVSRAISRLRTAALIALPDPHRVRILDRVRMQAIAEGSSAVPRRSRAG